MPPRMPQNRRPARPRGYDPTVSIASANTARTLNTNEAAQAPRQDTEKSNEDLKKLIETLKSKMGANPASTSSQKQVPPPPKPKAVWERSINKDKTWAPRPAYTILTRVSNHEKVPLKSTKQSELTINALPHSFLYRPGSDGIKLDKVSVKAGKQMGWG